MNVRELIDYLEQYDGETEVMIAHQPSWPLAEVLSSVVADSERDVHDEDSDAQDDGEEELQDVVWLVAGGHAYDRSPYAPHDVFDAL